MRTLFIVGALMLSISSADAQRSKPVQPRVEVGKAKLSEEDRRKVLEQMVELSQKQQVQLEAALQSEREVQSQLVRATNELVDAGIKALALQKAIDAQTDELNEAIRQRAEALKELSDFKESYYRLKLLVCCVVALLVLGIVLKVSDLVPVPWKYALYAVPLIAAGLLWFIL